MTEIGIAERVTERVWAKKIAMMLGDELQALEGMAAISVETECPLRYSAALTNMNPIEGQDGYFSEEWIQTDCEFTTDILIWEKTGDPERYSWIPCVVIECKLNQVTTHDVLTYAAKADKHRSVFPYLRYGLLIGGMHWLPARVPLHGGGFDFTAAMCGEEKPDRFKPFLDVIASEIRASRMLYKMMTDRRNGERTRYSVLHRPLVAIEAR